MEKKQLQIALGVVIVIAIISGAFNIAQVVIYTLPEPKITLVYSTGSGPVDLDPQFSWDSASNDVIMQVCEGLLAYNLSDPSLAVIPRLALGYVWDNNTNIRFYLRQNVFFHDGTPFNASCVKWTFDRMNFWCNATGAAPHVSQLHSLYELPSGDTIINKTTVISNYEVLFTLNEPFAAFTALLCYTGSSILSPTSHPHHTQLDTATGDLVGTGPFVYDHYISDVEVRFHRWERYWQTNPYFEEIVYAVYTEHATADAQMLAGEVDMIDSLTSSLYPQVDADPTLHRESFGRGLVIYYLGFNNRHIPVEQRFAMSHALNYSYIIDELREGYAYRMTSFVPYGIQMHDPTVVPPDYDVAEARTYMKAAFPTETASLTADNNTAAGNAWMTLAASATPLVTYNYTYNTGSWLRENLLPLLQDNFAQIGIALTDAGMSWDEYADRYYNISATSAGWESLQVFWLGWGPDYNDPDNFLSPLVSNTSSSNEMQVNDPYVQQLLAAGLAETDDTARALIYSNLQHYLTEVLCPVAPGITTDMQYVHVAKLKGFAYNAMANIEWYSCYFEE
jgi:peptide/nickel transport system substrate-binding protein